MKTAFLLLAAGFFLQFDFGFGDYGDLFAGLLDGIQEEIATIFAYLWSVIVAIASYIWSVLQAIYSWLKQLLQDIGNAFKALWEDAIKPALLKILAWFQTALEWLRKTFKPLLDFLQNLRKWLDDFFNKYVKPVLVLIQQLRQFLNIFRALGFKWAVNLDAYLGVVENKIVQVYETLRTQLNQVISFAQLIMDPTFLLRRNPLFGSLIRSAAELNNLMLTSLEHESTTSEDAAITTERSRLLPSSASDNMTYLTQGQLPPDLEDDRQAVKDALDALLTA